jgi:hypothetical protein
MESARADAMVQALRERIAIRDIFYAVFRQVSPSSEGRSKGYQLTVKSKSDGRGRKETRW